MNMGNEMMSMNMAAQPQLVAVMWLAMMALMMLPSTAPAALRAPKKLPFLAGYLGVWALFALAAAFVHFWLEQRQLLTANMALASHVAAGVVLIAIGAYELTPWKHACLARTRARDVQTVPYSLACLGASWALMGILFVVGVMSVAWIVVIALWIAAEKAVPWGSALAALAGVSLIGWGGVTLLV
jgi:predicted metal-binding membrane protein